MWPENTTLGLLKPYLFSDSGKDIPKILCASRALARRNFYFSLLFGISRALHIKHHFPFSLPPPPPADLLRQSLNAVSLPSAIDRLGNNGNSNNSDPDDPTAGGAGSDEEADPNDVHSVINRALGYREK